MRSHHTVYSLTLKEHEVTGAHSWDWVQHTFVLDGTPTTDETGLTTAVYRVDWDTTQVHNGQHDFLIEAKFDVGVGPLLVDETIERTLTVCNLTVDSVNPAGSIAWDGSTAPAQITVTLRDNDLDDPMDVTLSISSCADDPGNPSFAGRTITLTNVTGASHIFNWDGKDGNETDAEPGLYTYEVNVSQTDVNNTYPELEVADQTNYRSNYLSILRARDDEQNPIYDVEYEGYDDNGTPEDEQDDNYLYLIRWYALQDTGNPLKNASSGTLTLYDPDLHTKGSWSVASLQCVEHSATDGLVASGTGLKHGLRMPVPIDMMQEEGIYRFVLSMIDDHVADYRDHASNRPALDLNSKLKRLQASDYSQMTWTSNCDLTAAEMQKSPYNGKKSNDDPKPYNGYIAHALGRSSGSTITTNMPKDSLFFMFSHGDINGGMICLNESTMESLYAKRNSGNNPPVLYLEDYSMNKCRIAVWEACATAKTNASGYGNIAQQSVTQGADSALGFNDAISYQEGLNGPQRTYALYLWEALCRGKRPTPVSAVDCNPTGIADAAEYAAGLVRYVWGQWYGYNDFHVFGNQSQHAIPY